MGVCNKKAPWRRRLGSDPDGIRTHIVRTGILNSIHWTTGPVAQRYKKLNYATKMDNWQRIDSVIRWANMTINYFALYIGLPRGENLYQIKREIMVFPGTWPTRSWPNSRKSAWRGCLPARGRCLWTRNYAGCKFRFIRWMSNPISPVLTSWPRSGDGDSPTDRLRPGYAV